MADVVVTGGGMGGLVTAMLLAKDGHVVTVLERDPAPAPETPDEAWGDWERKGVNQFRMIHLFLPRFPRWPPGSRPPAPCASTSSPTPPTS
jgi:2-polyprenyl-6-methoxyphenol hydroxylase-like FAD-dependent oxidoreductase